MREELSGILDHVDRIQALDLDGVPPTTHVVALENVLRDDEPRPPSLPAEEALREAPEVVEGRFAVVRFE
jgi:aspartyl-tRNA(Asn)/glutamyl-tRNA(Gln) amidotransferase subunit C